MEAFIFVLTKRGGRDMMGGRKKPRTRDIMEKNDLGSVLVTGGAGFSGGNLARYLAGRKRPVRALIMPREDDAPLKKAGIEVVRGDLCDPPTFENALHGIGTCFHCASLAISKSRAAYFAVNVGGTENLLAACRKAGVGTFIFLSSTGVYGHGRMRNADENQPYAPDTWYSESNMEAEKRVFSYHKQGVLRGTVIRPRLIYGPGDRYVMPSIVKAIKKFPFLISGGRAVNDLVHMDDLTAGMVLAAENPASGGQAYHMTDGTRTTMAEQFFTIAQHFNLPPPARSLPYWLLYGLAAGSELAARFRGSAPLMTRIRVKMLGKDHHYAIEKARRDLGYDPKVNLGEGLKRTYPDKKIDLDG
jgi:nucleoside-diphosphate-sugar epimerase